MTSRAPTETLTMTTAAILARAIELDDDYPDDICPGCGQNIAGWGDWPHHYPAGATVHRRSSRAPWPFVDALTIKGPRVCIWDRDYLTARAIRRRLIAEGITT